MLFAWRCWAATNVYGTIPEWNNITDIGGCYSGCTRLRGPIPDFPNHVAHGYGGAVYANCFNLTGTIPALSSTNIKNMNSMFINCSSLSGAIPKLPSEISSMNNTFTGCAGLNGFWPGATVHETCPDTVGTEYYTDCYKECSDAVRNLAYQSWGGEIPNSAT